MSVLDVTNSSIEQIVDGIILFIKRYMIAGTYLTADAAAGDTAIQVNNSIRFRRGDQIAMFSNTTVFNPDMNQYDGIEIHNIAHDPVDTGEIFLKEPLGMAYTVANGGRLQKAIHGAILLEKDVYYGDREVIPFNQVAICVEPEGLTGEWIALHGMVSNEFRCAIMVYVKPKGGGDNTEYQSSQELAQRACNAYGKALYDMFLGNIHLDILVDEAPLVRNAKKGHNIVVISARDGRDWPPDPCMRYEVQDNWTAEQDLALLDWFGTSSSSSSSSISATIPPSTSSSSSSSSRNSSSSSSGSSSSSTVGRTSSSSSPSSPSSINSSSSSSSSRNSSSSSSDSSSSTQAMVSSSSSSLEGGIYEVRISRPLFYNHMVSDKAILRRKWRYMYDSRVTDIEYGNVQKGSAILKGGRMNWFGKETQEYRFPQVGLGGKL